ncbi:NUDIX domain-containing protein [Marinomonas sp. A3A]|jgi:ADP-ribose pyrophosphatase YjhB (NUDIX family)|uniref:NUDIX hydrolase n=2 Tax=Oceanospirillaceae TaxID=135620 RepID=UPI000C1EE9C4|nr:MULTISPECIES: NUDIX hydrolase [Marinomonas]PJE54968.1 DNA mismatch repair protein MutT [Marinomonas sp. BSi20584]QUX91298.1 NUDIX domain-containing protein [Marinomonas sp. A3A]
MRLLKSSIHPSLESLDQSSFLRLAARGIILKGEDILMLYTQRYDDYTLPGGGIDEGENQVEGLIRELTEETGARNIRNVEAFGLYEEFRPWNRDGFEIMQMKSYCYTCEIDEQLGETSLEDYEVKNGMKPVWINVHDAIKHNLDTIKNSDKKGMSIERETFLLSMIRDELLVVASC